MKRAIGVWKDGLLDDATKRFGAEGFKGIVDMDYCEAVLPCSELSWAEAQVMMEKAVRKLRPDRTIMLRADSDLYCVYIFNYEEN